MRHQFIFAIGVIALLSGCGQPDPAITARKNAYALCGNDKACFQRSFPTFYQTEVQNAAARRAELQHRLDAINNSGPTYTNCNTFGSNTSCTSY